jgi:hypothetical protein
VLDPLAATDPPAPNLNMTVTPHTGWPFASSTRTDSASGYSLPAVACCVGGEIAVMVAGMPAAVLVSEKPTDPYALVAVIV